MKNSRVIYLGTFTLLALSFAPAPLCELYCMPGDCKESAETKKIQKKSEATFSDCLAKLQTIVKWKEREAAQADKKDAPRLDDNEIKEARTAFLTTVERGQETLPNLAAKKDKTADMQLGQLTAVYAILQEEQFNDIRKEHKEQTELFPFLKGTMSDGTKLLALLEKSYGKDHESVVELRQSLQKTQEAIDRAEAKPKSK